MGTLRIGVLAYPGCFASEVHGIPDLLLMAGHVAGANGSVAPPYDVRVFATRRHVKAAGGTPISAQAVSKVDVLVVPGFELTSSIDLDATLAALRPEVGFVRAQADAGVAVVSVCVGAFLLAEAGLLEGRRATTSWLFAQRLARRHPGVSVHADQLVITDRGVTTSGGFSAMYDVALTLIRRYSGHDIARTTARIALIDDARSSQNPYFDPALLPREDSDFAADVKRRLDEGLASPYNLRQLADSVHASPRTLLRRFADGTGQTPLSYLQSARVQQACRLLETTDHTIATIAAEVGYQDPSTFSTLFARHIGRRPGEYRASFSRSDRHLPGAARHRQSGGVSPSVKT